MISKVNTWSLVNIVTLFVLLCMSINVATGPDCYIFNLTGKCRRGSACRFGSKHLTETGINIINPIKYEESKLKPSATKNQIAGSLQEELRKRKYDFSKAERIMKEVDESLREKRARVADGKPSAPPEVQEEVIEEKRLGPVSDTDLIKLRPSEKRRIDWKDKILLSPLTTVSITKLTKSNGK